MPISQLIRHVEYLKYGSDFFSDNHKTTVYFHKGTSFSRIALLRSRFNPLLVPLTLCLQFKLHTQCLKSLGSSLSIRHCRLKASLVQCLCPPEHPAQVISNGRDFLYLYQVMEYKIQQGLFVNVDSRASSKVYELRVSHICTQQQDLKSALCGPRSSRNSKACNPEKVMLVKSRLKAMDYWGQL